ncbi:DUF1059 domain-containing protein [Patescibacteria group bacterium]|jgi:predicted small metal-binding protein|nr:DUF1059 domain-containing protein [Patescibacteria group bacterium]
MFKAACRDLGKDCDFTVEAETMDEIVEKFIAHGREAHGLTDADLSPGVIEMAKMFIRKI